MENVSPDKRAVITVLELMALSAKTAPKSFGKDFIETHILSDKEQKKIAEEMYNMADIKASLQKNERKSKGVYLDWQSDAEAIDKCDGILLIGVNGKKVPNANCGGCGYRKCAEMLKAQRHENIDFNGPFCMYRILDLGIAASSAAGVAASHHLDNRIFQKVGIISQKLLIMDSKLAPILAIAVSSSGKNIFFDRKKKSEAIALNVAE